LQSDSSIKKFNLDIYDVLTKQQPISKVFIKSNYDNLFVVPSSIGLAGAEIELVSAMSRETILKSALAEVANDYDYILIDCPPSLGLLTVNALVASDGVFIPVQCEYFALEGLGQLINTINIVKKQLNQELSVRGVILTMYDSRTKLSKEVVGEIKKFFKEKVFEPIVPRNIRLSEAPSHGKAIIEYDPNSQGAIAYKNLAQEVINKLV
jgi:chromosome partitioning protein